MNEWIEYKPGSYPEKGKSISIKEENGATWHEVWRCSCKNGGCREIRSIVGGLIVNPIQWKYEDETNN